MPALSEVEGISSLASPARNLNLYDHQRVKLMQLKMTDLETERLRMRAFRQDDLERIAYWEGPAHAEKFLEFCLQSYREWGMGPWTLQLKDGGQIVGNSGFCRIRYDRDAAILEYCGEVNYYIAPLHRRQGFASEALGAILKFGFDDLRLTRIQARCSPDNVSSERVMQKAGLLFERMIASSIAGSPNEKLYAISREDFQAKVAASQGRIRPESPAS